MKLRSSNLCGIGPFHPKWIQRFANKNTFMIVYGILALIQGMSWSYFSATISTLEKRFKITSQTSGILSIGNELSQILFAIAIGYYGGQSHKPRWIGIGVFICALSCILMAVPQFIWGSGKEFLSYTEEYAENGLSFNNITKGVKKSPIQLCNTNTPKPTNDCDLSGDMSIVPLIIVFFSQFVLGIGILLFYTLGGTYLDDNVKKTKTPLIFGITLSIRLIGPTLGYLLSGFCLKLFINPFLTPYITAADPRWIGAWWMGWLFLGLLMALSSLLIILFPKELPKTSDSKKEIELNVSKDSLDIIGENDTHKYKINSSDRDRIYDSQAVLVDNETELPKISDIPRAIKIILFKNKVNLFNNLAGICYLFSLIGFMMYMPKYMETIFMQTAVNASYISGGLSILSQSVGLLASGALITYFKPGERKIAGWNVFVGVLSSITHLAFTQIGCSPGNIVLGEQNPNSDLGFQLNTACNENCNCQAKKLSPVCFQEENQVFFSACHAGCTTLVNNTILTNCSCLPNPETDFAMVGTCSESCFKTFIVFLAIIAATKFIDSTGKIGNMLVQYRCIHPKDKALSIGITIFLISIFALLPSPIVYGSIIDQSCLVWGEKCGSRGNCLLYDGETLRYTFNITASIFIFLGAIFDGLVWYYVKGLDLYDEEKNIENYLKNNVNSNGNGNSKNQISNGQIAS